MAGRTCGALHRQATSTQPACHRPRPQSTTETPHACSEQGLYAADGGPRLQCDWWLARPSARPHAIPPTHPPVSPTPYGELAPVAGRTKRQRVHDMGVASSARLACEPRPAQLSARLPRGPRIAPPSALPAPRALPPAHSPMSSHRRAVCTPEAARTQRGRLSAWPAGPAMRNCLRAGPAARAPPQSTARPARTPPPHPQLVPACPIGRQIGGGQTDTSHESETDPDVLQVASIDRFSLGSAVVHNCVWY